MAGLSIKIDRIDIKHTKGSAYSIMKHKLQMMKMRWLSAAVMLTLYTSSSWAFSIDDVAKQAQSLAGKGYETPKSNLPSRFPRYEIRGLSADPV